MRNNFLEKVFKFDKNSVYENFYYNHVRNCQLVVTIGILSSKSVSNSNLTFIILFGIPVKIDGVQLKSLLKNAYTKNGFLSKKINGALRFLLKRDSQFDLFFVA